tara:strand:- start:315 stop:614 length:300 start_codon:yes stop_codon:yes gene_type:complete
MIEKINSIDHNPGDLVCFNGVAMFYQTVVTAGALKDNNIGMIIKKIKFEDNEDRSNDCQSTIEGDYVIHEPKFVYTLLSSGYIVEVLDIDVIHAYQEMT